VNDETLVFTAFRACGRTISDDGKSWSGARGRTRTGMEFPPRDFRTRYSFRCWARFGSRRSFGVWTFSLPCVAGRAAAV